MEERINDKIGEIEKYLDELKAMLPLSFEEYEKDAKTKAACERYFEKIMEAATDLAFLVIKSKKATIPEDDLGSFPILSKEKIISENLGLKLREAKQMRNFISHRYQYVDDLTVYNSIKDELSRDVRDFLEQVKNNIKLNS
jgi:uncharacterized protein YutE (UPF0331/DUF86 family)